MHQEMVLTCVGEKKYKMQHSFMLLSVLHYLEELIEECEKILSYLVSQN